MKRIMLIALTGFYSVAFSQCFEGTFEVTGELFKSEHVEYGASCLIERATGDYIHLDRCGSATGSCFGTFTVRAEQKEGYCSYQLLSGPC